MAITQVTATLQTTNDTPATLWTSPVALTAGFVIYIFAEQPATGDQRVWGIHASRSDNDNSIISTDLHTAAGDATGWTVEIVENADALNIDVTGGLAETVNWVANIKYYD